MHPSTQLHTATLMLCLIAAPACSDGHPNRQAVSSDLALVGGKIYRSPDAPPLDDGVLLLHDGRVAEAGARGTMSVPPGTQVIDTRGMVVVPGFWNSHVHFTEDHWTGADTASAESLRRHLTEMLTRYGFVHVLDTGSWLANTQALRRRVESGEIPGPAILTTGPGFVPPKGSPFYILPAKLPELPSPRAARVEVATRLKEGADAIKLFTGSVASPTQVIVMQLDVVRAATAEAHRRGKLVLAHPTNNDGARVALTGGVDILAHTTPDGGPWNQTFAEQMKQAGMALIPTLELWKFELSRKKADSLTIERFVGVAIEQLRAFSQEGGEVLFGTDVGYMTVYDPTDEYRFMQRAGMSFVQILAALTTAPARRFGVPGKTTGRLERGTDADVVVLEGDPEKDIGVLAQVRYVLREGRVIYER